MCQQVFHYFFLDVFISTQSPEQMSAIYVSANHRYVATKIALEPQRLCCGLPGFLRTKSSFVARNCPNVSPQYYGCKQSWYLYKCNSFAATYSAGKWFHCLRDIQFWYATNSWKMFPCLVRMNRFCCQWFGSKLSQRQIRNILFCCYLDEIAQTFGQSNATGDCPNVLSK